MAHAFTVILDPGHGGTDRGASHNGFVESETVLQISRLVRDELKELPGIQVTMTRDTDHFVTLDERAHLANSAKGDLFLSIHCNSSPDKRAQGKEVYFQNQLPPDEEALFLANLENNGEAQNSAHVDDKSIDLPDVTAIIEDLERNHRLALSGKISELIHENWNFKSIRRTHPIRQAPFFVISNVKMPSALVEIGYLSNKHEGEKLSQIQNQIQLAHGIVLGIKKFKEFVDKQTTATLN